MPPCPGLVSIGASRWTTKLRWSDAQVARILLQYRQDSQRETDTASAPRETMRDSLLAAAPEQAMRLGRCVRDGLALQAGVPNAGDTVHACQEGFPGPGRTWFASRDWRC